MSGHIDALGDMADAALVATALDRPAGINAAEIADARHECANCGQGLSKNFCPNCGQKAHVHRSLAHVGEEFLHGITHFDGKAWRTLPMLLVRPGRLTRDYIMGKRARYIAPVPLFLLVVFIMFFAFSFIHITPAATEADGSRLTAAKALTKLPKLNAQVADMDRKISAAKAKGDENAVAALQGARTGIAAARDAVKRRAEGEITDPAELPAAIAAEIGGADWNDANINLGDQSLNQKARKALHNPELLLYKIQGKAYKLSFLLVPLSLPWLWLIFVFRRNVRMYDHAVFALYSISFMSLLFVIGSVAVTAGVTFGPFWFALVCLAPIAHMFVQLKGAYALTRFGAAWRTVALCFAAVMTLSVYAVLMIVIGVLD